MATLQQIKDSQTCQAIGGCLNGRFPNHLFCHSHWLMASKRTRRRAWREIKSNLLLAGYWTFVLKQQIAEKEVGLLKADIQYLRRLLIAANTVVTELQALADPIQAPAYLAAKQAVEEMMKRNAGLLK